MKNPLETEKPYFSGGICLIEEVIPPSADELHPKNSRIFAPLTRVTHEVNQITYRPTPAIAQ